MVLQQQKEFGVRGEVEGIGGLDGIELERA